GEVGLVALSPALSRGAREREAEAPPLSRRRAASPLSRRRTRKGEAPPLSRLRTRYRVIEGRPSAWSTFIRGRFAQSLARGRSISPSSAWGGASPSSTAM